MGIFQARILEQFAVPPGDLQNPGIEPRSPELQVDSLPSEPPEKPLVDSLLDKKNNEEMSKSRFTPTQ